MISKGWIFVWWVMVGLKRVHSYGYILHTSTWIDIDITCRHFCWLFCLKKINRRFVCFGWGREIGGWVRLVGGAVKVFVGHCIRGSMRGHLNSCQPAVERIEMDFCNFFDLLLLVSTWRYDIGRGDGFEASSFCLLVGLGRCINWCRISKEQITKWNCFWGWIRFRKCF